MSRLEEALRRAKTGATTPETFTAPGARALDWFAHETATVEGATAAGVEVAAAAAPVSPTTPSAAVRIAPRPAVADPSSATLNPSAPEPDWAGSMLRFSDRLITSPDINPVIVEQYRRVAALLHHVQRDRGVKVLMVASAIPSEGKTLTASNLALTLSESYQRRVLLIDADMRRPTVHTTFGVTNRGGLTALLKSPVERQPNIVAVTPQLSLLPAGGPDHDPVSGLTSVRMANLIKQASERFDWVIIDTPPVVLLPDANLLAAMVDTAILVVGAGKTPLRAIKDAVNVLGNDRILGVVLNRVVENSVSGNYGGHYGGYYSGYYGADKPGETTGFWNRLRGFATRRRRRSSNA